MKEELACPKCGTRVIRYRNPFPTVLETIRERLNLSRTDVATLASWSVFNAIAEHTEGSTLVNAGVEPLEQDEHPLAILGGDPDAIIADGERPCAILALGGDVNAQRSFGPKLDGVADQVLEQLGQLGGVADDGREGIVGQVGVTLVDRHPQAGFDTLEDRFEIDVLHLDVAPPGAGVREKVGDQRLHPPPTVHGVGDVPLGALVQLAAVPALQELEVADDGAQWLLQVV